jgi:hypothetical protein
VNVVDVVLLDDRSWEALPVRSWVNHSESRDSRYPRITIAFVPVEQRRDICTVTLQDRANVVHPFSRLPRAFQNAFEPLCKYCSAIFGETLSEDHDAVPFRFLVASPDFCRATILMLPTQVGDRPTVLRAPHLRVSPEMPTN